MKHSSQKFKSKSDQAYRSASNLQIESAKSRLWETLHIKEPIPSTNKFQGKKRRGGTYRLKET